MRRAYIALELREFDDTKREFEGIATTIGTDRYGDVVEAEGAQYALPIPLLWQHNASAPVGHVMEAKQSKKNIKVKGALASLDTPGTLKDRLDEAWQSLKLKLVRHLSIGFNPIKSEPIPDSPRYGLRFLEWEWLELSLVTIPANADASITALKRYDAELLRAASGRSSRQYNGVPLIDVSSSSALDKHGERSTRQRRGAVQLIK